MQCTKCQNPTTDVIRSVRNDPKARIERRRECQNCGFRFTTEEKIKIPNPAYKQRVYA